MSDNTTIEIKRRSQFRSILIRFGRNKGAVIGLIFFLLIVFMTIFADVFANYDDAVVQHLEIQFNPPSKEHIFGTDFYGRDLFARLLFGARYSFGIGFAALIIVLTFGIILGAMAGYFGGVISSVIMRIMDIFYAIPSILLAIAIVAALGQSIPNLIIAISLSKIAHFSRVVRSVVLPVKNQEYIEAAISEGAGNGYIIARHIIPNAIGPIIVQATLEIATLILTTSGLGFLGLGVPPPTPEWGSIMTEARAVIRRAPHLAIIPGLTLCFTAMSLNMVGDGLRDALDPKMKN